MKTIWVVIGSAGEYSDRQEWVVSAHSTREAAIARAKAAKVWSRQHPAPEFSFSAAYTVQVTRWEALKNPYDPTHQYIDPEWTVAEVEWAG